MTVYLVGAGPGDPELMTVRAARLVTDADVVVSDRLVDRRILALVRNDALVLDVGKHPRHGSPSADQAEINALLVAHGRTGACVVRLKGGDPFVFGRGAEEAAALAEAGVPVEIVPGITSAFAVPALAGVPVTYRGVATSVTVATGHDVDAAVDAADAASSRGTLVLLMAVMNREAIAGKLVALGWSPQTPVAAIERGSTPRERRIATTLQRLGDVRLEAPAVIVIGPVASMLRDAE
jgi:uroporphyrin-III C-methyltransferase/precorrin-2 dehydrogenase/sirohydrochlorin ferrochelatase